MLSSQSEPFNCNSSFRHLQDSASESHTTVQVHAVSRKGQLVQDSQNPGFLSLTEAQDSISRILEELFLRLRILFQDSTQDSVRIPWSPGFLKLRILEAQDSMFRIRDSWSSGFLKLRILEAQDSWTSTVIEIKPPIILVYSKILFSLVLED